MINNKGTYFLQQYNDYINKMEQEQQGFVPEKSFTFIDYKHVSYSLPKEVRKNPFVTQKSKEHRDSKIKLLSEIHETPFINSQIRRDYFHQLIEQNHKSLVFNSSNKKNIGFQETNVVFDGSLPCGNLQLVIRKKYLQFDLYMRPDTNTNSHFQWFYFRVHISKKKKVTFRIKNFIKATMLYSKGLRPFYRSKKQAKGDKFIQLKQQVKFYENQEEDYFNLQFTYDFNFDDDEVYFCSQPPYGLHQLNRTVLKLTNCRKFNLCKTIMGNKIPYLLFPEKKQCKIIAVAIARQHPGQVVGSWMMEGFLKALQEGKYPEYVQWIVIPMLNIDGVQLGNNRTGVLGHDFNRNWDIQQNSRKQKMFVENAGVLNLIKKIKRKYPKKMKLFLDFHGHSSQQNVFSYGSPHQKSSDYYYMSRLLPQIIAQKNKNFKLDQSSYIIKGDKKNAARSVIYSQCRVPFSYTIECTFGVMNDSRIGVEQIIKIGQDIAISSKQFIQLCFLKQQLKNQAKSDTAILKIKQKYSQKIDDGHQYESASQSSQQNQKREEFQNNVKLLLQQPSSLKSTIKDSVKHIKTEGNSCRETEHTIRKQSQQKSFYTAFKRQSMNSSPLGQVCHIKPIHKIKRVSTQQSPANESQKCCYFPPIREKKSINKFIFNQDQNPATINLKQIQKRLFKLRNSRIGKKILIINAYGV